MLNLCSAWAHKEIDIEHTSEDISNLLTATEGDHNLLSGVIAGYVTLRVSDDVGELVGM